MDSYYDKRESGIGKTYLAVGPGLKAIECGCRVLFTTVAAMIGAFTRALLEGRLEDNLKHSIVPCLFVADEIV